MKPGSAFAFAASHPSASDVRFVFRDAITQRGTSHQVHNGHKGKPNFVTFVSVV